MKKLNGKRYKDYTATDLRNFWCKEYLEQIGDEYQVHGYGGNELKAFKDLLEYNNIFDILVAIQKGIKDGKRTIKLFANAFGDYSPDFGKFEFFVKKYGRQLERDNFFELVILESKWLANADDRLKKKDLINWLEEWIEIKYGKL